VSARLSRRCCIHLARLVRTAAYVLAFVAPPVIAAVVGVSSTISGAYEPAATSVASPTATLPVAAHDPAKPTAVVVLSNAGSQVTDVLAPYEVLATTKEFNVYAAAPVKQPVPLGGGLDLMPQLTLDELDQRMNGRSPEVIVVPAMPGARWDGALGQGLLGDWLKRHISGADTVLSVCNGAEVLGEAGLLNGRRVTANWAGIDVPQALSQCSVDARAAVRRGRQPDQHRWGQWRVAGGGETPGGGCWQGPGPPDRLPRPALGHLAGDRGPAAHHQ
jgi:putative intracellular protease/amidase